MKLYPLNPRNGWFRRSLHLRSVYNAHDTTNTARIFGPLVRSLEANHQMDFYRSWFDETVPVALAMMKRGVGQLDIEARDAYRKELRAELRPLERRLIQACPFFQADLEAHKAAIAAYREQYPTRPKMAQKKWRSGLKKITRRRAKFLNRGGERNNPDLAKFLFDVLDFKEPPKNERSGKRSVDQDTLFWLAEHMRKKDEPNRWVLESLFHRSRLNTILSKYMKVDCEQDGRVRPTLKLYAAETLRWAYSGDPGEALHQWPKEARRVILARPGHSFISRDYSQLEARIMAVLAKDQGMLEAFARGEDIHKANALDLFSISEEQWAELSPQRRKETRNYAKSFLYKIGYGGKGDSDSQKLYCICPKCQDKVPQTLDLSRDDKKRAETRWNAKHRAILNFRSRLLNSIKGRAGDNSWTSPFGYRRFFLQPRGEAERSIYNFPMQHCAAEIVRRAVVRLHQAGAPITLQMHDEILLEVPDDKVDFWSERMRETMEAPIPELDGAIFPTDVAVGKTWLAVSED